MKEVLVSLGQLWRRQRYEFLTGSRIICKTPGYLVYAKMNGAAGATTTVKLYDGESAVEPEICDLSGLVTGSDDLSPSLPLPFLRGLYAALGAGTTGLTVIIITTKE